MTPERIAIFVLAAIAAVALVAAVARIRSRLATAKREWLELSAILTQHAMPHSARIFECLAVEGLPGSFAECKYLLRQLRDPKLACTLLDGVFSHELPAALSDSARRVGAVKVIADWIAANPAVAATVGLAVVTPK